MDCVIGLDIGTTGARAISFGPEGRILAEYYQEYPIYTAGPSHAEQDPEEIIRIVLNVVSNVTSATRGDIQGVGISSVLHSLMAVDKKDKPLTPLLIWADTRAADQSKRLRKEKGYKRIYSRTGCPSHPMYPLSKLLWIKEQMSEVFKKAHKFISIKEYLVRKLFGVYKVDTCVASGTGLFNIHNLSWDQKILEMLGLETGRLSEAVDGRTILRGLRPEYAENMGLSVDTPFVIGAGDGMLTNLAAGALKPGTMVSTIGTSGALRITVKRPSVDPEGRIWCYHLMDGYWILGGAINNGGIVLRWLRDQLGESDKQEAKRSGLGAYELFDRYASKVPPGSGGLIFLPFLTGERSPNWNPNARGTLFGLCLKHTKGHVIRAMMEGVIYRLYAIYRVFKQLTDENTPITATGGYVKSLLWLGIQADVFDREIIVPKIHEASALGAALLAMNALGMLDNIEDFQPAIDRKIGPNATNHEIYHRVYELSERLYQRLTGEFDEIVRIQNLA